MNIVPQSTPNLPLRVAQGLKRRASCLPHLMTLAEWLPTVKTSREYSTIT